MKRCPKCHRANADEAAACVLCEEPLADVDATLRFDPENDAEEWARIHVMRTKILRRDIFLAAVIYAAVIDITVMIMGLDFDPLPLLLFFMSGMAVTYAVSNRIAGQFTASFLQGGTSVTLIILFQLPLQPLVFFLILGHLLLPSFLYHWIEGMHNMYR